jgi:hypothetical protein
MVSFPGGPLLPSPYSSTPTSQNPPQISPPQQVYSDPNSVLFTAARFLTSATPSLNTRPPERPALRPTFQPAPRSPTPPTHPAVCNPRGSRRASGSRARRTALQKLQPTAKNPAAPANRREPRDGMRRAPFRAR